MAVMILLLLLALPAVAADTFMGLRIAPPEDCRRSYRSYHRTFESYREDHSLERRIVRSQGGAFSPYDGTRFDSLRESDIEHVVAREDAYASGLCRMGEQSMRSFVTDANNLTLATKHLNRAVKGNAGPGGWTPPTKAGRCWYARRYVRVKRLWNLTITREDAAAAGRMLADCP